MVCLRPIVSGSSGMEVEMTPLTILSKDLLVVIVPTVLDSRVRRPGFQKMNTYIKVCNKCFVELSAKVAWVHVSLEQKAGSTLLAFSGGSRDAVTEGRPKECVWYPGDPLGHLLVLPCSILTRNS